jgi:hypothetical protein
MVPCRRSSKERRWRCVLRRLAGDSRSLGRRGKCHGPGAVGVLCRVPRSLRIYSPAGGTGVRWPTPAPTHPRWSTFWAPGCLSILDGQRRYAHVTGLRGDEVAPQILGMKKIISDESLRRALAHLAPNQAKRCSDEERAARAAQLAKSTAWMDTALSESSREALRTPWILDIDTTIKLLYGHQAGAEIGYNPTKPGRPSHTLHTYWIGNLRLVLDVEVQGGKASAGKYSRPRLRLLLERLAVEERPVLVRGDIAFGNEGMMAEMEEIEQPYLFKLKQTAGVKRLIERLWRRGDWQGVGQGFDAVEGTPVGGLDSRAACRGAAATRQVQPGRRSEPENPQQELQFLDHSETRPNSGNTPSWSPTRTTRQEAMGQLYRDRADCENGFDELKNQWGWGGYTTQDLERCNLSARAVALIYNWWSWYVRLAHPKTRLEAITSRPMLLAGVARLTEHAGQSRLLLTLSHAAGDQIKAMIANVRKGLDHVLASAPQLPKAGRWPALVRYIVDKIIHARAEKPCPTPPALPRLALESG